MILFCCDKCGKEVKEEDDLSYVSLHISDGSLIPVDLCCDCMEEIESERERVRKETDTKFYSKFKYKQENETK